MIATRSKTSYLFHSAPPSQWIIPEPFQLGEQISHHRTDSLLLNLPQDLLAIILETLGGVWDLPKCFCVCRRFHRTIRKHAKTIFRHITVNIWCSFVFTLESTAAYTIYTQGQRPDSLYLHVFPATTKIVGWTETAFPRSLSHVKFGLSGGADLLLRVPCVEHFLKTAPTCRIHPPKQRRRPPLESNCILSACETLILRHNTDLLMQPQSRFPNLRRIEFATNEIQLFQLGLVRIHELVECTQIESVVLNERWSLRERTNSMPIRDPFRVSNALFGINDHHHVEWFADAEVIINISFSEPRGCGCVTSECSCTDESVDGYNRKDYKVDGPAMEAALRKVIAKKGLFKGVSVLSFSFHGKACR